MSKEIILRPVYNRPEMLELSIEYEKAAREHFQIHDVEWTTMFLVEHGAPKKVVELVNEYPFDKIIINRDKKLGLTINILEGMKEAFKLTSSYIVYVEDDVLLHATYFNYMDTLLKMSDEIGKFSVLSPFNKNDNGDVNNVYRGHHYAALAPLIDKSYFNKYVKRCANKIYYERPAAFVITLNEKYKQYWGREYKYKNHMHYEQAGLHNRLVDIALIEEGRPVIMPEVNRQQHIGFYGKNRPGGRIPGDTYEERVSNLREITKDPKVMYKSSATPQYNDYKAFSPKLREWNGDLTIR